MKNLKENMKRFGTKNLLEQSNIDQLGQQIDDFDPTLKGSPEMEKGVEKMKKQKESDELYKKIEVQIQKLVDQAIAEKLNKQEVITILRNELRPLVRGSILPSERKIEALEKNVELHTKTIEKIEAWIRRQ